MCYIHCAENIVLSPLELTKIILLCKYSVFLSLEGILGECELFLLDCPEDGDAMCCSSDLMSAVLTGCQSSLLNK